ncbi:hypothetical protein [Vibrio sp. CAU 1672]|uniref:hypothetical protein n=1 Tax=Vibrio sp. CAU 1672 TaxID=3032594 RepID=UPI0023DC4EA3|nr:hypothetical protein [Vibrio sp. CAU 1672]MDF2154222.1 hypothetical protein [Vibrio sp. CAU 1672]
MKYRESGIATLLVTGVLLMVTLVVVLGAYRGVFFQIKRAQNEVKSRQQHWLAEGAIECGWAQYKALNSVPVTVTDCGSGFGTIPEFTATANGYQVSSAVEGALLRKEILVGGNLGFGAMQSSADVYFHSSATFSTPDPGELGADGWECVALRYKNRFYSAVVDNKGVIHGESPYPDFSNPASQDCANVAGNDHLSSSVGGTGAGKDFVHDETVKPFESFFGVKAEEHNKVRDNGTFRVLSAAGTAHVLPDCGTKLTNQINSGNHHLWVEGSCEISSAEYNDLVAATQNTNGVTVMVHDGLFSVMGPPSSGATTDNFRGVIFHFNYDYTPTLSDWSGLVADGYVNHVPSVFEESYRTIAAYYQHGSFTVSGGQYFDMEGQAALFFDSLDFRYSKAIIDNSRNANVVPRWKQGSWYAK